MINLPKDTILLGPLKAMEMPPTTESTTEKEDKTMDILQLNL